MTKLKHDTIFALAIAIGVRCKKGQMDKVVEGINWLASILTKEDWIETKNLIADMKEHAPDTEYHEYIKVHVVHAGHQTGVVDPFSSSFE